MSDLMKEYTELDSNTVQIHKKLNELFYQMFKEIGFKREHPFDFYKNAKYSPMKCEVGDMLQTQTMLFRRVK